MDKSTNVTEGASVPPSDIKFCSSCDEEIPVGRLHAQPEATLCVPCLEREGDVRKATVWEGEVILKPSSYLIDLIKRRKSATGFRYMTDPN